jgi:AcrR family transcriptional regulator
MSTVVPDPAPRSQSRTRTRRPRDVAVDAILEAATRLFGERGYKGTTVAAVAAEVGLTDAGVLHHFPTKLDLVTTVLDRTSRSQGRRFRELMEGGGLAALRGVGDWGVVMESAPHEQGMQIALSTEAIEPGSPLHGYYVRRYEMLRDWLTHEIEVGIERGEIRPGVDPRHEASALIAVLDGLRLQWFFGGVPSLADAVRSYVDQLVARLAS